MRHTCTHILMEVVMAFLRIRNLGESGENEMRGW